MVVKIVHPSHNFSEYSLDILWKYYYPVYYYNKHIFKILPPREFIRGLADFFSGDNSPKDLVENKELLYNFVLYQRYDFISRGSNLVTIHELVAHARPSEHGLWSKIKIGPNTGLVIETLDAIVYSYLYE